LQRLHHPSTLDEVRRIVAGAPRIRVLGSRHSFDGIADSSELLSLGSLTAGVSLDGEGRALANLASLPHISVAGTACDRGWAARLGGVPTRGSGPGGCSVLGPEPIGSSSSGADGVAVLLDLGIARSQEGDSCEAAPYEVEHAA
jgi:hypothetical protein